MATPNIEIILKIYNFEKGIGIESETTMHTS